jgi:radical SAM protein with 4Fe4S-binding SPASM domain
VRHQVIIRCTQVGEFVLCGESVLEIDEAAKGIITLCDGCHTIGQIAEWAAQKEGEPVDTVYDEVINLLDMLSREDVIEYQDSPDFIAPIYTNDRPLSVIWEITYACNQKCKYCIARAGKPAPDELSQKEIDTVLTELIELKVGLINITGGEPLLKKDMVLYIAEKASDSGIELELLTNGSLVTPDIAHKLYNAGIQYAQVSIDCVHPHVHDAQRGVPGSWEKAVDSIAYLREAGIHVMAAAVMNNETVPYFVETRNFLDSIADTVKMGTVMPMGKGENNACLLTPDTYLQLQILRNTTEDNLLTDFIFCRERCSIGTTPVIAPNGDVYPCMLTKYPELKLGNVKETSIRDIYANSSVLSELFACTVDEIEPCNTCWNRYYCGGGCRGCAFAYYGTIYKRDAYQCEGRKKFAKELLKRGHPETKKALKELIKLTTKKEE